MKLQSDNSLQLKIGDLIIIAAVLLIAGLAVLFIMQKKEGNEVLITSDDSTKVYSLNKDREIKIRNKNGGYNLVIIKNKSVFVKEADCKNQICVDHKPINKDHETIVCLPNKLFIEIKSSNYNDIDN